MGTCKFSRKTNLETIDVVKKLIKNIHLRPVVDSLRFLVGFTLHDLWIALRFLPDFCIIKYGRVLEHTCVSFL